MLSICFSLGLVIIHGYWNSLKLWARLSVVGIWRNSHIEDVALSPPVCLAGWALLRQTCISAASRQICYLGIHCLWKLAISWAIVANSVKLALDNSNSNVLLFKGLSRGSGDVWGASNGRGLLCGGFWYATCIINFMVRDWQHSVSHQ